MNRTIFFYCISTMIGSANILWAQAPADAPSHPVAACTAVLNGSQDSSSTSDDEQCRIDRSIRNLGKRSVAQSNSDLPATPEVGESIPVGQDTDSQATKLQTPKHFGGVLAGRISGPAGSGPGGVVFYDLYHTHGFFFQPALGYFQMGGAQKIIQQATLGPSPLNPQGTLVQRVVANVPGASVIPVFHIVYAPKEYFKRIRPGIGAVGVIAIEPNNTKVFGQLLSVDPSGKAQLLGQQQVALLQTQATKFGPSFTAGASIRVKGRVRIDALCASSPNLSASKRTTACMSGIRW